MTKLGGLVGSVTIPSKFDFGEGPDSDPTDQWDTKCKLFSLVEGGMHSTECHSILPSVTE